MKDPHFRNTFYRSVLLDALYIYIFSCSVEFDAKKLFKLYKNTLKQSEESSPKKNSSSPVKQNKDTKQENGSTAENKDKKSAKKKKKDKDKDKEKTKDKAKSTPDAIPKSDRFGKPGLAPGTADSTSPIKRKRDVTEGSDKGTPNSGSYKRMNMEASARYVFVFELIKIYFKLAISYCVEIAIDMKSA